MKDIRPNSLNGLRQMNSVLDLSRFCLSLNVTQDDLVSCDRLPVGVPSIGIVKAKNANPDVKHAIRSDILAA